MRMGVLAAGDILPTALPAVETEFKIIWANHGDDISRQYAGGLAAGCGLVVAGQWFRGGGGEGRGVSSIQRMQVSHKNTSLATLHINTGSRWLGSYIQYVCAAHIKCCEHT